MPLSWTRVEGFELLFYQFSPIQWCDANFSHLKSLIVITNTFTILLQLWCFINIFYPECVTCTCILIERMYLCYVSLKPFSLFDGYILSIPLKTVCLSMYLCRFHWRVSICVRTSVLIGRTFYFSVFRCMWFCSYGGSVGWGPEVVNGWFEY